MSLVKAAMFSSANVRVWDLLVLSNVFVFIPKVDAFSENLFFWCWRLAFFCYLYYSFYGYTDRKSISIQIQKPVDSIEIMPPVCNEF